MRSAGAALLLALARAAPEMFGETPNARVGVVQGK